jgi:hypothetical protein
MHSAARTRTDAGASSLSQSFHREGVCPGGGAIPLAPPFALKVGDINPVSGMPLLVTKGTQRIDAQSSLGRQDCGYGDGYDKDRDGG